MARRFFLTPVVEVTTPMGGVAYASKAATYGVAHAAVIPSQPDGTPRFGWCLVLVDAADLAALRADGTLNEVPGVSLSATLGSLSGQVRNQIQNRLTALGVDLAGVTLQWTIRQLLIRIVQSLDAACDLTAVGAGDVA